MSSRIRVLAVSAIILLGMTAQAQACFWPFCGYGRPVAWGGPVGYGRPVAYRRGFYAGYYAATSCYSPCSTCGTCSSCGVGGCSTCGVSTYYGPSCCSTCGSACYGGCSTCGTGGCANCSTNYYPDGSSNGSSNDTDSTYADDGPTEATTVDPRDDDFGPGNRSTDNSTIESESETDSIPDDFQTPINPSGEPTNGEEPPMARPLQIGPQVTWQVLPTRSRVHVEADIRAPRVARVDASPASAPNLSVLRIASFEE